MDSGFAIGIRANYRDAHRINRLRPQAREPESALLVLLVLRAQAEPALPDVSAASWQPTAREPADVATAVARSQPVPGAGPAPDPVQVS